MKKSFFLLLLALSLSYISCNKDSNQPSENDLILTRYNGTDEFSKNFQYLTFQPSKKDFLGIEKEKLTGFPDNWMESNNQLILIDPNQYLYQNYKAGNVNEETYKKTKVRYKINTEQRLLSDTIIRCSINIGIGKKKDGTFEFIVDENRNNDLSDDQIRIPLKNVFNENQKLKKGVLISYDLSTSKGVVEKQTNFVVGTRNGEDLMYNFSDHYLTTFDGVSLKVSNNFYNVLFDINTYILPPDGENIIALNEYLTINNSIYKNLGVNLNTNRLRLSKISKDSTIFSSQAGYKGIPFSVSSISNNQIINLSDFSGNYLYVDFWGTWCGPCVQEVPELKAIHEEYSSRNLKFLGISVDDDLQELNSFASKNDMNWPQAYAKSADRIIKDYNIQSYPTSVIFDPKGKILAKNIRVNKLRDTLDYYLNLK